MVLRQTIRGIRGAAEVHGEAIWALFTPRQRQKEAGHARGDTRPRRRLNRYLIFSPPRFFVFVLSFGLSMYEIFTTVDFSTLSPSPAISSLTYLETPSSTLPARTRTSYASGPFLASDDKKRCCPMQQQTLAFYRLQFLLLFLPLAIHGKDKRVFHYVCPSFFPGRINKWLNIFQNLNERIHS